VDRIALKLIREARAALDRLEAHLDRDTAEQDPDVPRPPAGQEETWRRWWSLLSTVAANGGTMDANDFRALAVEHGYDPRGIGGFFGGQNSTMRRTDDTVELTARGRREVDYWAPTFANPQKGRQ